MASFSLFVWEPKELPAKEFASDGRWGLPRVAAFPNALRGHEIITDVLLPNLAQLGGLVKVGQTARTRKEWNAFLPEIPRGNGAAGKPAPPGGARGPFAQRRFFRRLLLRR